MIRSKIHILEEWVDTQTGAQGKAHPIFKELRTAANYCVEKPVLDLIRRNDVQKSITALCEAGIARLPVPKMVIEFEADSRLHEIVMLKELPNGDIEGSYATMFTADDGGKLGLIVNGTVLFSLNEETKRFDVAVPDFPNGELDPHVVGGACVVALTVALLMLNTLGIEKEVVDVTGLNKARAKKGRCSVVQHSVVRIGHIYRRDGSTVRADGGTARTMPMHIRQAHTRRQRFGVKRSQEKLIFIPMCLVNYREGEDAPQIKRHVTV